MWCKHAQRLSGQGACRYVFHPRGQPSECGYEAMSRGLRDEFLIRELAFWKRFEWEAFGLPARVDPLSGSTCLCFHTWFGVVCTDPVAAAGRDLRPRLSAGRRWPWLGPSFGSMSGPGYSATAI